MTDASEGGCAPACSLARSPTAISSPLPLNFSPPRIPSSFEKTRRTFLMDRFSFSAARISPPPPLPSPDPFPLTASFSPPRRLESHAQINPDHRSQIASSGINFLAKLVFARCAEGRKHRKVDFSHDARRRRMREIQPSKKRRRVERNEVEVELARHEN